MDLGILSGRKSEGDPALSIYVIMTFLAAVLYLGSPQVLTAASNDTTAASSASNPFDADTIRINMTENSLELIGNAIVHQRETIITADHIKAFFKKSPDGGSPLNESSTEDFEESFENIVARGNVKIVSEGSVATGDEAVYDRASGKLVLTGNPASLVNDDSMTSSSEFKADRIVFNETEVGAEFTGNVRVAQEETVITADNIKAFFKKSADGEFSLNGSSTEKIGDSVEKIVARGNVKIVVEDNVATGDEAVYDSASGKFVLTGDPATLVVGVYTSSASVVEIIGNL